VRQSSAAFLSPTHDSHIANRLHQREASGVRSLQRRFRAYETIRPLHSHGSHQPLVNRKSGIVNSWGLIWFNFFKIIGLFADLIPTGTRCQCGSPLCARCDLCLPRRSALAKTGVSHPPSVFHLCSLLSIIDLWLKINFFQKCRKPPETAGKYRKPPELPEALALHHRK